VTTAVSRAARRSRPDLGRRIAALDWPRLADDLDDHACAIARSVLTPGECHALVETYTVDARFRRRIVMAQHGFGRGEYQYFAYPLPDVIAALRAALYPRLAAIANRWNESMGTPVRYPEGTLSSSSGVIEPVRSGRHRSSCDTVRATTTACTRTSTASTCFPFRSPCCSRRRAGTSRAGSSCWSSSGRADNRASRSSRSIWVTP
jgi:Oxygenase, catalysing oxidative methylation of damaged DNA